MEPLIMKVGFEEDPSVQSVIEHLTTVRDTVKDIDDNGEHIQTGSSFLDQFGLSSLGRTEIVSTINNSIKAFEDLGKSFDSIPEHLSQSFSVLKTEFEGFEKSLNNFHKHQNEIAGDKTKSLDSVQSLMMSAAAIKAQTENIKNFQKLFKGLKQEDIGWSKDVFMKHSTSAVGYIDSFLRQIIPENKNGVRLESLINQATTNREIRSFVSSLMQSEGVDIKADNAKEQVSKNIEMLIRSGSEYLLQTSVGKTLDFMRKKKAFDTLDVPTNVEQRFKNDPYNYQRNIYAGFGHDKYTEEQAAAAIAGRKKADLSWRFSKDKTKNTLSGLYEFLQAGNNMDLLFPLLKETGIATIGNEGTYKIREQVREEQLQRLRALALQEYNRALRSDAIYEASPTSVANAGKIVKRQGKNPQLYLGLNEALPEVIIPSLNTYKPGKTDGYGNWIETRINVGETPGLSRYYIPQTSIDFSTGRAVTRSNFWQKDLSKGIQENEDDEFVAITDSLLARLFGMEGNRSLGFGNDETGAIRRVDKNGKQLTPNLIVSNFSKFITRDDKTGEYIVDTSHPDYKAAEDLLSRKTTLKYGINPESGEEEEYRFLYSKDDGRAIFGKESIVKKINDRFEGAHLPSIFDFGNDREGGLFFGGGKNFQKTTKQINALAKIASSGTEIESLLSPEQAERLQAAKGIYANFEMLYEILDENEKASGQPYTGKWSKIMGRRMDGLAFGDPTIFGRDFQGRYAGGTEKFAMGAYDWRPMLLAGWNRGRQLNPRLYGYDTDVTGMSDEEKMKHRAIFAPTGGASKEDRAAIEAYIKGETYRDPTTGKVLSENDLREQYFTNVVASDAAFIIDRTAQKSGLSFRTMRLKHYWDESEPSDDKGLFSAEALKKAREEGRVDNEGNVRLNAAEQEEYKRIYAQTALGKSGFILMKNEGDMLSEKDFIPESVLRATNAPSEVFARSERLYNERLKALQTTAGRIAEFKGDANAMEAIRQNPNWVWENQTAITHIEQTRRSLEANRARNMVMLNGDNERREGAVAVGTVGQLAEIMNELTGLSDSEYGEFQVLLPKFLEDRNAVFSSGISAKMIDMLGRFPWASGQYMMDVRNYAQYEDVNKYFDTQEEIDSLTQHIKNIQDKKNKTAEDTDNLKRAQERLGELKKTISVYDDQIDKDPEKYAALRVAKALKGSKRDPRKINSMIMTASQIYSMNTGDFDGDTVNAFIGLSKEFKENARKELNDVAPAIRENRLKKLREAGIQEPDQVELSNLGEAVMKSWAMSSTATEKMAVASAALRKAQTSENSVDRIAALAEAMEAYDLATSDVKTKGAKFTMGSHAEQYLYSQGAHYERFIKQLQDNAEKVGAEEDLYKKGEIFKFSGYGTTDPEGLFAISARHSNAAFESRDKFIKKLKERGIEGEEYNKRLADFDAQKKGQFVQGKFDLDSYQKLENWYKKTYGIENSEDAQAARFMLDRMEDTLIWGQLWDDDKMKEGRQILAKWRSRIDAMSTSGVIPEEQIRQANDFEHRLGEMEKGATASNIREIAEQYRELSKTEQNDKTRRGYELFAENLERMLPENQDENERKAREAFINSQKEIRGFDAKRARELVKNSTNQEENDAYTQNVRMSNVIKAAEGRSPIKKSIYNWSNLKHFIGAKTDDHKLQFGVKSVDLNNVFNPDGTLKRDENGNIVSTITDGSADYYKNASDFNKALRDIVYTQSGEIDKTGAYNNASTHIGQLMHFSLERILDPTEVASRNGRADQNTSFWMDWLRNSFLGTSGTYDTDNNDAAALRSLGYKITEKNGRFIVSQGEGKFRHSKSDLQDVENRLNNLFGKTVNGKHEKGFIERQADYINALEKENGEEVLSIEDKLFRNGQRVNIDTGKGRFGGNFYRRIVTDKEGKIVSSETALDRGDFKYRIDDKSGEKEHVFETHAKPDRASLMAPDEEGHRRIHIYDWKSSLSGADESVPQSVFYGQLFGELAKRYHDSVAEGKPDERYEQFKEWGWYDKSGKFVNALGLVSGVDAAAKTNRDVDFTTPEGIEKAKEWMHKMDKAMLLEEELGLEGFKDSWSLLESASAYKNKIDQETKTARELAEDKNWVPGKRRTDFFLATYAQNKERLKEIESDIYKEHNRYNGEDYVPFDRFTRRNKELTEMFSQEMLAAQLRGDEAESQEDKEAIDKEIQDIQTRRTRALLMNEMDARRAASQDLVDARTSIRQELTGVKPTQEANLALNAMHRAQVASRTMEYLTGDERYYDAKKIAFRTRKNGETDSSVYEVAEAREEAYMNALAERETTNKFLDEELNAYYKRYDKNQTSKIESLTRLKPLNPIESFNKYVEKTIESLEKEIDQYNENIRKYDEEMNKKGTSNERKAQLQRFKERDQKSANELRSFIDNGGVQARSETRKIEAEQQQLTSRYQTLVHAQELINKLDSPLTYITAADRPTQRQIKQRENKQQKEQQAIQQVQQQEEIQQAEQQVAQQEIQTAQQQAQNAQQTQQQITRTQAPYTLNRDKIAARAEIQALTSSIGKDMSDLEHIGNIISSREQIARIDKANEGKMSSALINANEWLGLYKTEEDYVKSYASEDYLKAQEKLAKFEEREDIKEKRSIIDKADKIIKSENPLGVAATDPIKYTAMLSEATKIRDENIGNIRNQIMQDAGIIPGKMTTEDETAINQLMSDIISGEKGKAERKIGKATLTAGKYMKTFSKGSISADDLSSDGRLLFSTDADYLKSFGYTDEEAARIQQAGTNAVNEKIKERKESAKQEAKKAVTEIAAEKQKITEPFESEQQALSRQYQAGLARNKKIVESEGRYALNQDTMQERARLERDIANEEAQLSSREQTGDLEQLKERQKETRARLNTATTSRDRLGGAINNEQEKYVLGRIKEQAIKEIKKNDSLSPDDKKDFIDRIAGRNGRTGIKTFDELLGYIDSGTRGNQFGQILGAAASRSTNTTVRDYMKDYIEPEQQENAVQQDQNRRKKRTRKAKQQRANALQQTERQAEIQDQQQPAQQPVQTQPATTQQPIQDTTQQPSQTPEYDRIKEMAKVKAKQERLDARKTIADLRRYSDDPELQAWANELETRLQASSLENRTAEYEELLRRSEAERMGLGERQNKFALKRYQRGLNQRAQQGLRGNDLPVVSTLLNGITTGVGVIRAAREERVQLTLRRDQEQARLNQDANYLALANKRAAWFEGKGPALTNDETNQLKLAEQNLNGLDQQLQASSSGAQKFTTALTAVGSGLTAMMRPLDAVVKRFGRQLFYSAINEAKRFVKEFDKSMTTIQMITLKTDSDMAKLSDTIIGQATELKTSVSNLAGIYETLYRQGLSDAEVEERAEIVTKFSRVSGTKTDAANKLITVAMNTGLVTDPQIAADIVTALGDNAATNAAEIEKGIEKAGAAAAADGTTFAELAAMLTAITSTTQIGGNVAGRTINTIIGRMNKIGTNELIYDENGNAVSGSAVAKLLEQQGISMYDVNGNKKSTYETLYALSQKWEGMSDAEQQQIATAIAGTRQYSNFAAIMQGMSEGKVDEYMGLAKNAEGIVDKKDEIYLDSLEAKLNELKTKFDSFINDLLDKDFIKDIIDDVMTLTEGAANLIKTLGGLKNVIKWLTTIKGLTTGMNLGMQIGGLFSKFSPLAGAIGAGAGALLGGVGGYLLGNEMTSSNEYEEEKKENDEQRYKDNLENIKTNYEKYDITKTASQIELLRTKGEHRTTEEENEYKKLISSVIVTYGNDIDFTDLLNSLSGAAEGVDELSSSATALEKIAKSSGSALDEFAQEVLNAAGEKQKQKQIESLYEGLYGISGSSTNGINKIASNASKRYQILQAQTGSYFNPELSITMSDHTGMSYSGKTLSLFTTDSNGNIVLGTDLNDFTYGPNAQEHLEEEIVTGTGPDRVHHTYTPYLKLIKDISSGKRTREYLKNVALWIESSTKSPEDIIGKKYAPYLKELKITNNKELANVLNNLLDMGIETYANTYLSNDTDKSTAASYIIANMLAAHNEQISSTYSIPGQKNSQYKTSINEAISSVLTSDFKDLLPDELQSQEFISYAAEIAVQKAIDDGIIQYGDEINDDLIKNVMEHSLFKNMEYGKGSFNFDTFMENVNSLLLGQMYGNPKYRYSSASGYYKRTDKNGNASYFSPEQIQKEYDLIIANKMLGAVNRGELKLSKIPGLKSSPEDIVASLQSFIGGTGELIDDVYTIIQNGNFEVENLDNEVTLIESKTKDALKAGRITLEDTKFNATAAADYLIPILEGYDNTDAGLTQFFRDADQNTTLGAMFNQLDAVTRGKIDQFVQFNEDGSAVWTGADTWDKFIIPLLYSSSASYGGYAASTVEKGETAREAVEKLQKGAFFSAAQKERVQANSYNEYAKEQEELRTDLRNEKLKQKKAETGQEVTTEDMQEINEQVKEEIPILSREDYIKQTPELNLEALDDTSREYLKEALGSEGIYSQVLTNAKNLPPEVLNYINRKLTAYANGSTDMYGFDREAGIDEVMQRIREGTLASYDETTANLYMNGITGSQQYLAAAKAVETATGGRVAITDFATLQEGTADYEAVAAALEEVYGSTDAAKAALKSLDAELQGNAIKLANKYGDATDTIASNITNLAKGGKAAAQTIGKLRQQMAQMNNAAVAISKAKGKSGAQLNDQTRSDLAAVTGESEELIKEMSKEQIEALTQRAQDAIDEEFITDIGGTLTEKLNALAEANPTDFEMAVKAHVGTDGALDLSEIAAIAEELGDEALAELASHAGTIGELLVKINEEGLSATATMEFIQGITGKVTGSGKRQGKSGGGGGKSKVDELLEKQKHRIAKYEHESKMLEIKEKEYDFYNDYGSYDENIDAQIANQQELRKAYIENIAEMEELLAKTKEDSDDWWKLKEAIDSANESLAGINNTINELNGKRITILEQAQQNADKPGTHLQNMLEKLAQRATTEDRFEDYAGFAKQRIEAINAQKSLNEEQLKAWEAELLNYEEGSDSWLEVRDKIWAIEEENAELENQAIQQTIELNEQRLSQIAKVLQYDTATATHNQNIANTYGGYYQGGGYRTQYENMLRLQMKTNAELIAENKKAEQSAIEQMKTLEQGSSAWYSAQAAVYQYQEAIAQTEVSQQELNRTLAESNIEAISDAYTDATREVAHVNEMLAAQADQYLANRDYSAYSEAMSRYIDNISIQLSAEQAALAALQDQYAEGMAMSILDPSVQRQYLDQINEREKAIQNLQIEQEKQVKALDKNNLDRLFEEQDNSQSAYDHNMKLVQYQATKYQNAGELTNYGRAIEMENELRKDRVETLKDEIDVLKEQQRYYQDKYGEGTEEEIRIVDAIKKHEEALKSENVEIEKNNKLLEDNKQKIRQVQKTLEDAVDKEIEDEKKRQREILAGNVSMQDTILDLLKKRLQEEWDLKKKDIEKEKESLNEYKKLINERFNYRKKASQQTDTQEELAEYKRQLALIEADITRTKEAKELRKKIADMEKEQAWSLAEDELAAENERIDQQAEGMDAYVQYNEEKLNEILSDANNFSTELNDILSGSYEESYEKIIAFMEKENEAFMKSLPDAQKQMIQGWEDTWKKANDIVDSNYAMITNILQSKDSYMEYMKSTNRDYRSYLENGDENSMRILEKTWSDYYDDYINSQIDNAEFELHDHTVGDVVSKIDELEDNVFKVNIIGIDGTPISPYGLSGEGYKYTDNSNGAGYTLNEYLGIGKVKEPEPEVTKTATSTSGGSGSGGGSSGLNKYYYTTMNGRGYDTSEGGYVYAANMTQAKKKANEQIAELNKSAGYTDQYSKRLLNTIVQQTSAIDNSYNSSLKNKTQETKAAQAAEKTASLAKTVAGKDVSSASSSTTTSAQPTDSTSKGAAATVDIKPTSTSTETPVETPVETQKQTPTEKGKKETSKEGIEKQPEEITKEEPVESKKYKADLYIYKENGESTIYYGTITGETIDDINKEIKNVMSTKYRGKKYKGTIYYPNGYTSSIEGSGPSEGYEVIYTSNIKGYDQDEKTIHTNSNSQTDIMRAIENDLNGALWLSYDYRIQELSEGWKHVSNPNLIYSANGVLTKDDGSSISVTGYGYTEEDANKDFEHAIIPYVNTGYKYDWSNKPYVGSRYYSHGGVVDYTGPAWVDGTPTRPESFLDAVDTKILRSMLDSFNYIRTNPYMSHIDSSLYGNNTSIGDINITINQADLGSETDINKVAKQVGQAFTKELKINGLNLSGYAFA